VYGPIFDRVSQGEITDGDTAWKEAVKLLNQLVG
jgi:cellobiose transport system substrate-binding protein